MNGEPVYSGLIPAAAAQNAKVVTADGLRDLGVLAAKGVDLTEELLKSIEKKTKRDALRHIENPKLKA